MKTITVTVAGGLLKKREKYSELFGSTNVNIALMFLTFNKFNSAISTKNKDEFNAPDKD